MYKLHLILKYLGKRRIAWVSLIAVMLCTMMVLVVISIMGGWVRMFENSFHGMTGDIVVDGDSLIGFAGYEQMIERIEKLDCVVAAVPSIKTFALINIDNRRVDGVQVIGFPIEKIGKVNDFPESLYLGYNQYIERANDQKAPPSAQERQALLTKAAEAAANPAFNKPLPAETYRKIVEWKPGRGRDPAAWPGMIVGAGVVDIRKNEKGEINRDEYDHIYQLPVKLTVMPISPDFASMDFKEKVERNYWIADDSRTTIWQYDANCVYVPFDALQEDLDMGAKKVTERDTGKEVTLPARCTELQIAVKEPFKDREGLQEAKRQIQEVVTAVLAETEIFNRAEPKVVTWREHQSLWLDAVEKEKLLTVFLFSIISVVAIFLIFCIFYMVVAEKTKDIGIIKSVGASGGGVATIFLGYGLAIGIVGSALGLLLSYLLVKNINEIHGALGRWMGVQVWNPEIYLFDKIPNTMDPKETAVIVTIAVVASVLGALVPALKAGSLNPVEALRFE